MNEFISTDGAAQSGSVHEQKNICDEVAQAAQRIRRAMDVGLTPEDMKAARGAEDAVLAAQELLSKIF